MRKLFCSALLVVLVGCSGGDDAVEEVDGAEATTAAVESSDGQTVESSVVALPPLSSVPFSEYTTNHVEPPVTYPTSPSTGGDHYAFWHNCGYYNVELSEGAATHTMEHGAVWITYNADIATSDDLAALEALAAGNGKLLISPYDHDDAIILSAWGVQQRGVPAASSAEGAAAINEFVEAWVDNPELFEAGVSCGGAVGVPPDQPRLFPDGAVLPDEFG